jgi:hypothetical protein
MAKMKKPIDPRDFTAIPRIKDFINALPENVRVCSEHGEPVYISESDLSLNPGAGPPFGKADFIACCEPALKKVVTAVGYVSDLN